VGSTPTFGTDGSGFPEPFFVSHTQILDILIVETAFIGFRIVNMAEETPRKRVEIRRRTGQFSGIQVMFAAILSIGLFLAIDFSGRITASQPLQQAYESVRAEIDDLRAEQQALIRERDYVRSDAYVAQWARSEGKLIQPGEVLVVPVPSGESLEAASVPSIETEDIRTTPPEPQTWTLWWNLFFDSPPPRFE
jgi:cell division protein FtsB